MDNSQDFDLTWAEYKAGFGDLTRNFWLGNDALNELTSDRVYQLRIEMQSFSLVSMAVKYGHFRVDTESNLYRLDIGTFYGSYDAGLFTLRSKFEIDPALTSSSRHLRGKSMTKQSKHTDLYARRTGLANVRSLFDLIMWGRPNEMTSCAKALYAINASVPPILIKTFSLKNDNWSGLGITRTNEYDTCYYCVNLTLYG